MQASYVGINSETFVLVYSGQSLEKELPTYGKRYHDLEKDFEDLMNDNGIREDQQETIGEEMDNLRVRWRSLNNNKDAKKNR